MSDKSKIYESEGSHNEINLMNDISQVNLKYHDRSFNDFEHDKRHIVSQIDNPKHNSSI